VILILSSLKYHFVLEIERITAKQTDTNKKRRIFKAKQRNRRKTETIKSDVRALAFDTCVYFSLVLEEGESQERKISERGIEANHLFHNLYKERKYFGILFDTISWEYYTVMFYKLNQFQKTINEMFKEYERRINNGEKLKDFWKTIKNEYIIKTGMLEIYAYFERKGFGFSQILDTVNRTKFLIYVNKLPIQLRNHFDQLNKNYVKVKIKAKIIHWINDRKNQKKISIFFEKTSGIGKKDRFHLLACYFYNLDKKRSLSFVSADKKLIEKGIVSLNTLNNNCKISALAPADP